MVSLITDPPAFIVVTQEAMLTEYCSIIRCLIASALDYNQRVLAACAAETHA